MPLTNPQGFTTIENYAFQYTKSLEHLYLPSTLEAFGLFTLRGSGPNLVLHLTEPCASFTCWKGKILLTLDKTRTIAITDSVSVSDLYDLPSETTILGSTSFAESKIGPAVTFPDQIEILEGQLFAGSTVMTHVEIGKGISSIAGNSFISCINIQEFTVHSDTLSRPSSSTSLRRRTPHH